MQDWQGILTAGFLALGGWVFLRIMAQARAHEIAQRQVEAEAERRKKLKQEREKALRESSVVTAGPAA